eukprot:1177472-Prorocentrum_minimum.AAC.3
MLQYTKSCADHGGSLEGEALAACARQHSPGGTIHPVRAWGHLPPARWHSRKELLSVIQLLGYSAQQIYQST